LITAAVISQSPESSLLFVYFVSINEKEGAFAADPNGGETRLYSGGGGGGVAAALLEEDEEGGGVATGSNLYRLPPPLLFSPYRTLNHIRHDQHESQIL
jgi:hypothetical protein